LTGKYLNGIPEGSRAALPGYEWLRDELTDATVNAGVRKLKVVADELQCTLAQLALAWCARNPHVSTVITGATTVEQVNENLQSLAVLPKLTESVLKRIDELLPGD
jgi:aryl-alcohol dehydrogenase-like predicted oxidoreductase